MRDFRKIIAWQKADDLTVAVYHATRVFPREEIYALTSQIRRSAYSVPSNIAEGSSRSSKKDYLHVLYISRGSLSELCYFIHLSNRLGYLSGEVHTGVAAQADESARVLAGLIQSVEREVGVINRMVAKTTALLAVTLSIKFSQGL